MAESPKQKSISSVEIPTVVFKPTSTLQSVTKPAQKAASSPAWDVNRLAPLLIIVAIVLAYASAVNTSFVFDDEQYISRWPVYDPPQYGAIFAGRRFVTKATFLVNYWIEKAISGNGINPRTYKLTNILIHACASLALLVLARRALRSKALEPKAGSYGPHIATAIALLWAVHPLTTQAVTYVVQRMESMMSMFILVTIVCLARCADATATRSKFAWSVLAVTTCALGSVTKEVMIVTPLLALLYDRTFIAGTLTGAIRSRWALYLLLIFAVSLPWWAFHGIEEVTQGKSVSAGLGMNILPPMKYFSSQPGVILGYLWQAVWPRTLCFDWLWPLPTKTLSEIALPFAVVSALGIATLFALWRAPVIGFAAAWVFIMLGPSSSFMPIADLRAEHRMYLPLAGCVALIVGGVGYAASWFVKRQPQWKPVLPLLGACAVLFTALMLGVRTHARNLDYATPVSLWASVIKTRPASYRAQNNLGAAYFDQARGQSGQWNKEDLYRAAEHIELAIKYNPTEPEQYAALAVVYESLGDLNAAERTLREGLKHDSNHIMVNYRLGVLLMNRGHLDDAAECFTLAITSQEAQVKPVDEPYNNLAIIRIAQKRLKEAEEIYRHGIQMVPTSPKLHGNLAQLLYSSGRNEEAIVEYSAATAAAPSVATFQAGLARALLKRGDIDGALTAFNTALLADPGDVAILLEFADVQIGIGSHDGAVDCLRRAASIQRDDNEIRRRLVWVLATAPSLFMRDTERMMRLAVALNERTGDKDPAVLDALAAAFARGNDFDKAVEVGTRAADAAEREGKPELAKAILARVDRYREGKPYEEGITGSITTRPGFLPP